MYSINPRIFMACSQGRIIIYNTLENTVYKLSEEIEHNNSFCAATDSEGNIWLGSEYGIYVIDKKNYNIISHYEQSPKNTSQLDDTPIYSLYKDRDNNIWVGTYFGGINYYIYGSDQFRVYPYGNPGNHLSGKAVRQIISAPGGGELIATEDGGINFLSKDKKITRSASIHKKFNLGAKNIHSLMYDSDNTLWIGLFSKGVMSYNEKLKQINRYNSEHLRLSSALYRRPTMKRVYYSGYIHVNNYDSRLPALKQVPLIREHRLYQADWLLRFYQFGVDEIVDDSFPELDLDLDPKLSWALRHPEYYPIDVNRADYEWLLRIPGVGVKSAKIIVASRRFGRLGSDQLKKIGVVMKKARYFIECNELPGRCVQDLTPERVKRILTGNKRLSDTLQLSFQFKEEI